jgi:hypothetical protein
MQKGYNGYMGEREFLIYLDMPIRKNRYRHFHTWEDNRIVEFRIQFEAFIGSEWFPIVRYDTAHGKPHRDVMRPDGSETKEWFETYSKAEVLTLGQRDIMENWPYYRKKFEKEMKK